MRDLRRILLNSGQFFLGHLLKDRRTLLVLVCEARREDTDGDSFRHPLRRLFDLDGRTCRKYKPSAPVLTPLRAHRRATNRQKKYEGSCLHINISRILALIIASGANPLTILDSMGGLPEKLHSAYTVFLVCGLL